MYSLLASSESSPVTKLCNSIGSWGDERDEYLNLVEPLNLVPRIKAGDFITAPLNLTTQIESLFMRKIDHKTPFSLSLTGRIHSAVFSYDSKGL